jgi:hypothetical protein
LGLHKIRCADGTRTHPIKPGTLIGDENDLRVFRLLRQPVPDAADALEIVEIDGNDRVTAWRLRCAELIRRQALDIEQPLELPVHAPRVFGRVAYCSKLVHFHLLQFHSRQFTHANRNLCAAAARLCPAAAAG